MIDVSVDIDVSAALAAVKEGVREAADAMAESILEGADRNVPVGETGNLKESGHVIPAKYSVARVRYDSENAANVHDGVSYAADVEFSEGGRGYQFLRRGLVEGKRQHVEAAGAALKKKLGAVR